MAHPFRQHQETAPMITLAWGKNLAPVVSAMIVDQPGLAPRLVLAPRRVIHALAAYIHHAIEAQHETTRIGADIEGRDVRALLSESVMNPHRRLYRMLDRLGPTALDMTVYQRLNEVLHGPAADLLLDADEITGSHLNVLTKIVADRVLLAARKAIKWSETDLQNLTHALKYLRVKGLSNDIENLPPGAGWRAIMRRISSDLGRARAPRASFAMPAGCWQVEDVAELWRVGTALGNCVSSLRSGGEDHVEQFIAGDAVYLARDDEPMMLACIRNVGPNLWTFAETTTSRLGSDIMKAREALRSDLITVIAETGGELLDEAPLSAMRSLAWRTKGGAADDLNELEDVA
jgi:hypothetical protein